MYTVENKFEIGEECYSVYRKPIQYKSPICQGKGRFEYNGYDDRFSTVDKMFSKYFRF